MPVPIIQHRNPFIRAGIQPPKFNEFLKIALDGFSKELNIVANAFYQYPQPPEQKHPVHDDLFTIIERTWLGLFNNSIVRSFPNAITMQEFNVWDNNSSAGRCDFLLRFEEYDIIIEAKNYEFNNTDWKKSGNNKFYRRILDQAKRYYENEIGYYTKPVILMAMVFEWIRNKDRLEEAKKIMNDWIDDSDAETDFVTLFYGTTRGLFVYGKTEPTQPLSSAENK